MISVESVAKSRNAGGDLVELDALFPVVCYSQSSAFVIHMEEGEGVDPDLASLMRTSFVYEHGHLAQW